jgi:hypothetical protein
MRSRSTDVRRKVLFHVSSPVRDFPEFSVGVNDRTDKDRLLHRGGGSLQLERHTDRKQ